jgi:CDGSH-type Zn-finger protein
MARLVKRYRDKPYELIVGGETLYICGCGLSLNQPYCDGSHKIAQAESAAKLYWYDEAGRRNDAPDGYPDIRSDSQP